MLVIACNASTHNTGLTGHGKADEPFLTVEILRCTDIVCKSETTQTDHSKGQMHQVNQG